MERILMLINIFTGLEINETKRILILIVLFVTLATVITIMITGLYLVAHPGIPKEREEKPKKQKIKREIKKQ